MKKLVSPVVLAGAILLFISPLSVFAKPIILNFTMMNPETSLVSKNALKPWVEKIEKATQGRVKINVFYSQTLSTGAETWNAVKNGIADMGWACHGYWQGMTPVADVTSLPAIGFKNSKEGSRVLWELYNKYPEIKNEFSDNHVIAMHTSQPFLLVLRDKQVKRMEDIEGLKIRVPGGVHAEQMKALGAVPVMLPMPDTYVALQKGTIDGMGGSWESTCSFRHYEVTKSLTLAPLAAINFSIIMNKRKWNSLSVEIQEKIMATGGGKEGSEWWGENAFDKAKIPLLEKIKEGKYQYEINKLSEDEWDRWVEASGPPVWNKWLEKMKKKGVEKAQEILDTAILLSKQNKSSSNNFYFNLKSLALRTVTLTYS